MPPAMKQVFSSHIDAVGYDPDAKSLHVQWKNGKTTVYQGVPPEKGTSVVNAPSVGEALHQTIRGQHPHETF